MAIRLHVEDGALLRQAIVYTAGATGFTPRLVEKDYFCSVALEYLAAKCPALIFKGGTCLSKIHSGFHRLSEDLDFTISTATDSTRGQRSQSAAPLKAMIAALPSGLSGFQIIEPLRGANGSTQYNARVGYESLVDGHAEPVSIEVGVCEPTMLDTIVGAATTTLLDPLAGAAMFEAIPVTSLSYLEAMAEKVRAALCRNEVAIRDYFDVEHAVRTRRIDPFEPAFLDLVRRKIAIPRTGPMDVSEDRVRQLHQQLESQLRPVLRDAEFAQFDLHRATEILRHIAAELEAP